MAQLEITEVTDDQAPEVAALCLEHVADHPEAVERLLFAHANVRSAAFTLLEAGEAREPEKQIALAMACLKAGHEPGANHLAPEVAELVRQRREFSARYWAGKAAKHASELQEASPSPEPAIAIPPEFPGMRLPFYHQSPRYGRTNFNDKLPVPGAPAGTNYACVQLSQRAKGSRLHTQGFLDQMRVGDVRGLDYAALDAADKDDLRTLHNVNFSPSKFGRLLTRLALDLPQGARHSFRLGWRAAQAVGHAMRVFVEKMPDGRLSVGLYEPNVSGDIVHMKVFPEELAAYGFQHFDTMNIFRGGALSLSVAHEQLAHACAGVFVEPDGASQTASLAEALAYGNVAELEAALGKLHAGAPLDLGQAEQLSRALYWALQDGHAEAARKYLAGLAELGLTQDQTADLAAGTVNGRFPALFRMLEDGRGDAAEAYVDQVADAGISLARVIDLMTRAQPDGSSFMQDLIESGSRERIDALRRFIVRARQRGLITDTPSSASEAASSTPPA